MSDLIPITTRKVVDVTDPEYFCNKSWTLSFNMNTKSWTSFHSYIPNFYIGENNFFYSGLNGGCDLEAIAATEIPYTTTSTTTIYCPGCQPPLTTTSTTTKTIDCRLAGSAVAIPPGPTTTTTSSSSSSTTSTTSTTTTLCPGCNTYTIQNNTQSPKSVTFTTCSKPVLITVPVSGIIHVCSCTVPVVPTGVTSTLYGSGCITCFCYTVENFSSVLSAKVQWAPCGQLVGEAYVGPLSSINICAKEGTIYSDNPVTITGGITSCTTNSNCETTTTTTTTEFPVPICSQNLVSSFLASNRLDVWDLCVDYNKNVTTGDYGDLDQKFYMTSNSTKVWTVDYTKTILTELNITFNPFSGLTYNQVWSAGIYAGSLEQICAKGDAITNTLIANLGSTIVEIDLTVPSVISFTPTMPGTYVTGIFGFSMIYVPGSNKLIMLTNSCPSGSCLTQYDYATGLIDVNIDISAYTTNLVGSSLFSTTCDGVCAIYIYDEYNIKIWKVNVTTQEITDSGKTIDFTTAIRAISQLPSCTCMINTTTTTTTLTPDQACVVDQGWSTTNLAVVKYRNDDDIPLVTDPTAWAALTTGARCCPNDDCSPANIATYGYLYNWYAVNDPRGLAPLGYHIPTNAEWIALEDCLGGILVAGGKMKETGFTHWNSPNTDASNSSGFTALGTGVRQSDGSYVSFGEVCYFWKAEDYLTNGLCVVMYYNLGYTYDTSTYKELGLSVRVIQD